MRRSIRHLIVGLFVSFSCLAAIAQTAQFSGQVTDPQNAVVPNAQVRVVNQATGVERKTVTNRDGLYTLPFAEPGTYQIFIQAPGFSTAGSQLLTVTVGQTLVFNVRLQVGQEQQQVTVNAGSQIVNTTDGSVSTVIDRKFAANIPLNGRSFQDLISMTPGVLTQSPQTYTTTGYNGDFSVNGQRTESNYYTVDGVTGNVAAGDGSGSPGPANAGGLPASTALGTTQSLLSVDAMQEFRVASSTYSAEFGRSPGGQFSFVTRSGTNDFHGTIFDYFRNDIFDSNDWFNDQNDVTKAALHQNDFGGTLGGPIRIPWLYNGMDKSFFFVSYEGLRLTQPQASGVQYVPDSYMRQQVPLGLQPIVNAYPLQTGIDYGTPASPNLAVFAASYSVPSTINSTSVRLDHSFSPKLALFFRASYTPTSTQSRNLAALTSQNVNTQTYTLGATSQLSQNWNNQFRLEYADSSSSRTGTLDSFGGAQPVDLMKAMAGADYGSYWGAEPELYVPGIGNAAFSIGTSNNTGRQWNIVDSVSWSHGRQQFKAGIDYLHVRSGVAPTSPFVAGIYESVASILSNQTDYTYLIKALGSTPVFNYGAAFIQDEWRLTSRLSLSGGVRWEIDPPPTEAHGNDAYTLYGDPSNPATLSLAPQGTPLWKTTYYNFAPRLGVAWQAHSTRGWETVVRVGAGVFFDSDNGVATQGYNNEAIGLSATSVLSNIPLPSTPAELDFPVSATPPFPDAYAYAFPSHLQLPYTIEWNTSLEQALGERQSFTISYVAANGRRLVGEQEFSFTPSQNPNFGNVFLFNANLTSSYNSLQLKFQRSAARGLQALTSYTWSHSLDFGSEATQLPTTRGNSDFDVRHNLSAGLAWDIPTTKRLGAASVLVNNWGLDGRLMARTAFPITLSGDFLTDSVGANYYGGVNFVPKQPYYLHSKLYPGGRALNPAAFVSNDDPTENGTVPRNYFRGFGEMQLNLSLRRTFHITDSTSLQFHADSFNLPNHPNFGAVDASVYDALFGQATATLANSLTTVASQYQQGGPRSFQLSLKLLF